MIDPHWSTVAAATGITTLGVAYVLGAPPDVGFAAGLLAWVVGGWAVAPLLTTPKTETSESV